ncbi:ADP-glyceromanno-heptose 6-epimerase precursor [Candidatus Koribacter versatilis Ellin345]|uniref:ADP-L-glycero-D-manno-heptose-6-epimerase n=1 Tax=Koribacter versatilis (strain Ellin345) TaxID=204669 RepID=Q1IJY8_KORVE|nr:ADP-glyceromanno-heptose 6-epimerase [Candidatus Koribacter versatilis]ABF42812.1 ADP-glyceromanno-heptose 6-epimerase precursor [Candidatus Koribacter versatilis Ellin345]
MVIVTGGAGFIGSNLVHELNAEGITDVLVVDNLANAAKFENLLGAKFADYMDKRAFRAAIRERSLGAPKIEAILHQGACSNTLEDDGVYMMDNNYQCTKELLHFAIEQGARFVFASTAAVYGLAGPGHFAPIPGNERPLNIYGYSKLMFDNYLRHKIAADEVSITAVGLRYFNVYGPRERHKGRMSSVIHHFTGQMKKEQKLRMFQGSGGYGDGEQRRDFVYVRDLARMNLFFAQLGRFEAAKGEPERTYRGIVNAGTGLSRSFNDVAAALMTIHGKVPVEYMPFPSDLIGRYQHFTEADISGLRKLGWIEEPTTLEAGIDETYATLRQLGRES